MGNAAFEDAAAGGAPSTFAAGALETSGAGVDSVLPVRHPSGTVATVAAPTEMANRTKKVRMAGVLSKVRT
jgi:hypothetical protein